MAETVIISDVTRLWTGLATTMPAHGVMHKTFIRMVAGLLAYSLWIAAPAWSASFPNLYTVTVAPAADAEDRRSESIRLGMARLLMRLTGRRDAGVSPDLAHMIESANEYMNSYGLLDRERDQVGFIASDIDAALTAANWPIWVAERPLTLVWITLENAEGERAILSENRFDGEFSPELVSLLRELETEVQEVADGRGLPITFPQLVVEDLYALRSVEPWSGFDDRVEQESNRLQADARLIGHVSVDDFGFSVHWTFAQGERSHLMLTSRIGDGLDWLADQYAAQFSFVGGARAIRVTVSDIANFSEYGEVMSYLETLSVLDSIDVEGFDGSVLNLRVLARGDENVVQRVLNLGGVLRPVTDEEFLLPLDNALMLELIRPE